MIRRASWSIVPERTRLFPHRTEESLSLRVALDHLTSCPSAAIRDPAARVMQRLPLGPVSVSVSVHQPAPDRTQAIWLDSAPDLSSADSTQAHCMDAEHQPTDLAVGGSNPSRRARTRPVTPTLRWPAHSMPAELSGPAARGWPEGLPGRQQHHRAQDRADDAARPQRQPVPAEQADQ